ncbi:hypothetical protein RhiLY_12381 [Ceratobasidium sp. AG-Ba]|nr:hypothetical protein RhiLY_12381 [Ceratobasidium sp. AG-Ba]
MSRKANNVSQPSLATSRARRANAGIPPEAFDAVTERIERRNKQAAIQAKATTASRIESNPYTGDDSPARDPLEAFREPTPTGDPEEDQANWEQARIKWLVRFLARRDGVDVRPALRVQRIGLPELEEIHNDPEVAQDLLTCDEDDPNQADKEKGKQPAVPPTTSQHLSKRDHPQVQTGYAGILVDSDDYTIQAKHTPKSTPRQTVASSGVKRAFEQGPGHTSVHYEDRVHPESNMHGLRLATAGQTQAPLHRTDSTTVLDGERVVYPMYHTPRGPLPASKTTQPTLGPKAVKPGSNQPRNSKSAPQNHLAAQGPPAPKKPRFTYNVGSDQAQQHANTQATPNQVSNVDITGNRVSAKSTHRVSHLSPGTSGIVNGQPLQAKQAADATRSLPGPASAMVPEQEFVGSPSSHADHDVVGVDQVINRDGEQNAPASAKAPVTTGKATIKSFAADEQPIIERMSKLAKAYIIANGPYDDSPIELATQYDNWPEDWVPRKSRLDLVSKCLKIAGNEYDLVLPFVPRHVKCVTELVRTHHTGAADRVKPLVDHAFKFTLEKSDHNKTMSKRLLPFNFHYRDTAEKRGPFKNPLIEKACRAVAFQKASAVGPKNDQIHYVIWAYRSGEFSNENLDADIQGAAFRRALRFLITMHQNKARQLDIIRYKIYDRMGFEPRSTVRDPTPEPERQWTPDTDEQYIRRYEGCDQVNEVDELEMGGSEANLDN